MRSRRRRATLVLLVLVSAWLALGTTAGVAADCRRQVIDDWSDNGRVDRLYALECYEQAMRTLPPTIRDYSDAPEVIDRALTLAVRRRGGEGPAGPSETRAVAAGPLRHDAETTAIPASLFVLGALALSALSIGGVAYAGRRASSGRRGGAR